MGGCEWEGFQPDPSLFPPAHINCRCGPAVDSAGGYLVPKYIVVLMEKGRVAPHPARLDAAGLLAEQLEPRRN